MGGVLSVSSQMEMRREDRDRTETYNMLLESDSLMRSHRDLRRELGITRCISVILLTLLCISFSILFITFYYQHSPAARSKERGHGTGGKASEAPFRAEMQVGTGEDGPKRPLSATLTVACPLNSEKQGKIPWKGNMQEQDFFTFDENQQNLTITKEGMYKFSLQVTYRGIDSVPCPQIDLFHYLDLLSDSYPKQNIILEVYDTVFCKNSKWKKTIYSEINKKLYQGDQLMVVSEKPSLIDCGDQVWAKTFLMVQYEPTG